MVLSLGNIADIAKRALVGGGSGAHLRAPEADGFFIAKYAFSLFSEYLFVIF